jgi:tetrahydromethanopterin S-methyltransferase subunit D
MAIRRLPHATLLGVHRLPVVGGDAVMRLSGIGTRIRRVVSVCGLTSFFSAGNPGHLVIIDLIIGHHASCIMIVKPDRSRLFPSPDPHTYKVDTH